jgi:hypothetical protein
MDGIYTTRLTKDEGQYHHLAAVDDKMQEKKNGYILSRD